MNLELTYTPALELARQIKSRNISPLEIVTNALERIESVNESINAFCFVYAEEALDLAREIHALNRLVEHQKV